MNRRTGVRIERNAEDYNHNDQDTKMDGQILKANNKTTAKEGKPAQKKTMSSHIETRKKIKEIASVSTFRDIINSTVLTREDRKMLELHYLCGYDFRMIGDILGYSESTIKRRHKKALAKISKIL